MNLDRLLLTTDLSDESLRAFAPLADLARAQGSSVTLLHVVEDEPLIPRGAAFASPIHLPGAEEDQRKAEAWLDEHGRAIMHGISLDVRVIRAGKVAQAIADYAREQDYGVIAMSTHGRSGFRGMILGSVAADVLRHADRPVIVFPRHARE
jgi:nucleotide-binding universal stress UspA family protein